jgi:hypothetical protein
MSQSMVWNWCVFVQLGFNLSNGVTDTLESSTILIYSDKHMSLYTQSLGRMPKWLNGGLKAMERGASLL